MHIINPKTPGDEQYYQWLSFLNLLLPNKKSKLSDSDTIHLFGCLSDIITLLKNHDMYHETFNSIIQYTGDMLRNRNMDIFVTWNITCARICYDLDIKSAFKDDVLDVFTKYSSNMDSFLYKYGLNDKLEVWNKFIFYRLSSDEVFDEYSKPLIHIMHHFLNESMDSLVKKVCPLPIFLQYISSSHFLSESVQSDIVYQRVPELFEFAKIKYSDAYDQVMYWCFSRKKQMFSWAISSSLDKTLPVLLGALEFSNYHKLNAKTAISYSQLYDILSNNYSICDKLQICEALDLYTAAKITAILQPMLHLESPALCDFNLV